MTQARRAILRALAVAGVGGVAGCIGEFTESTSDTEPATELDMAVSELVGDGTDNDSRFGATLALGADGTTAVVTAYDQNNADEPGVYHRSGALYVFEKSGGSWSQEVQFVPEDLGVEGIGAEVAVSGDGTTVIAEIDSDGVSEAIIFEKSGGSWASQTELSPPVTTRWNRFASAVALSSDGRTATITNVASVEVDSESQPGVAYVFEQSDGSWSRRDTLYDSGADTFGRSVSFSADDTTVVVGAYASAYVFTQSDGSWSQDGELATGNGYPTTSVAVSADGSTAVVGHHVGSSDKIDPSYVYTRSDGTWSQQAELVPAAEDAGYRTTTTVGIADDGSSVVISARGQGRYGEAVDNEEYAGRPPDFPGAAYVFDLSGGSWSQRGILLGNKFGRGFGHSMAVGATTESILVGDRTQRTESGDTGAAFIYEDA